MHAASLGPPLRCGECVSVTLPLKLPHLVLRLLNLHRSLQFAHAARPGSLPTHQRRLANCATRYARPRSAPPELRSATATAWSTRSPVLASACRPRWIRLRISTSAHRTSRTPRTSRTRRTRPTNRGRCPISRSMKPSRRRSTGGMRRGSCCMPGPVRARRPPSVGSSAAHLPNVRATACSCWPTTSKRGACSPNGLPVDYRGRRLSVSAAMPMRGGSMMRPPLALR